MPGASPNGSLPQNAIAIEPTIAAKAVAVKAAPIGIPSKAENIIGLTARIYDMVRNVVIPARTSVFTVVCLGSNPKSLVSIYLKFTN